MVTTVGMREAETRLTSLAARAIGGEEIVIARGGKPQVKLVPVKERHEPDRAPGSLKGRISIPDRFLEPMSEEDLRLWKG